MKNTEIHQIATIEVPQYEATVFDIELRTGEHVKAIRQGERYWELERAVDVELEKGQHHVVCYVSSYPLENQIFIKNKTNGLINKTKIKPLGNVSVTNARVFFQEDGHIKLGDQPYYLNLDYVR